jgi:hypothetical protein
MGSGNKAPNAVGSNDYLFGRGGVRGAEGIFNTIMQRVNSGLPQQLKDIYEKRGKGSIAGLQRDTERDIRQRYAGTGAPIGAVNDAYAKSQEASSNALSNLFDTIAMRDEEARQTGIGNFFNLTGLGQQGAAQQNQYNLQKYQIDESNKFKFGDLLGSLVSAGGNVAGMYAGRPGKK